MSDPGLTALRDRLPKTAAAVEASVAQGQSLGAQLYVSLDGRPVAEAAIGESRPGVPMATDTLVLWMSMGKPLTAILIAKLVDAGRLRVDQPVAEVIPEFAEHNKGTITIAHLLTHTGGIRNVGSNWSAEPWSAVVARVCDTPIEAGWVVGETAGYHTSSSWYILAEVARRSFGYDDPRDLYRRELFEPLGMNDSWVGMPRHRWTDYGRRVGFMFDTSKLAERGLRPVPFPNGESGSTLCRPGGNARGPVRELGRFYEQLLIDRGDLRDDESTDAREPDSNSEPASNARAEPPSTKTHAPTPAPVARAPTRRLSEDVARAFTSRQRVNAHDLTFNVRVDWGYGFLINAADGSRIPYGYGPHASRDAFGHSGNQSSCAFADPRHALVVCWATNGMPGELAHQRRQRAIIGAVYEDLGLTTQV